MDEAHAGNDSLKSSSLNGVMLETEILPNSELARRVGTPKTLKGAVIQGLLAADAVIMSQPEAERLAGEIMPHVMDFLAQRFGSSFLLSEDPAVTDALQTLWSSLKIAPKVD